MIRDDRETQVVSSLGWVDKGSLWVYRIAQGQPRQVPFSDARYLSVHAGSMDHFAVVHHYDDSDRLRLTAHHHKDPEPMVGEIEFRISPDD